MGIYLLLLSMTDLIIFGIIFLVIICIIIFAIMTSRKQVREKKELSEDVDMIQDLWYGQVEREATAKYKVYTQRGYTDKLPEKVDAISQDRELQKRLIKTRSTKQRKALLSEYVPKIMFPLVVCKYEGLSDLSQKEAAKLKQLMWEYDIVASEK